MIISLKIDFFLDYRFCCHSWMLKHNWDAVSSDAAIEAGGGEACL